MRHDASGACLQMPGGRWGGRAGVPRTSVVAALALWLAGCAVPQRAADAPQTPADKAPSAPAVVLCQAASADDVVVGHWLAVRRQKGVAGELRTWMALAPDGELQFVEQVKRGNRPPQTLEEKGCWWREGDTLVLRTTQSYGLPVDADDPIYVNRHRIHGTVERTMMLRMSGESVRLRRVAPDYRLPVL